MFVLKVFLGITIIILSVKIGVDKANKYKKIYYFWQSLVLMCDKFLVELLYKKANISSLKNCKYPFEGFNELLKNFFDNKKISLPNFLSKEESILVYEFFNSIGKTDTNSQIKEIESFKNQFLKISIDKNSFFKKYYTVSIKLGFICGLGLFIMVI